MSCGHLINRVKSEEIYRKSCEVIPGGVNSPARSFKGLEMTPMIVSHGKGSTIIDEDGHSYIDFCGSWGALLHGHAPDFLLEEVKKQLEKGSCYGIVAPIEERLARFIVNAVPGIDKVRFMNSGTEAVMTAVKMARGYTGRSIVITFEGNYHGHSDLSPEKILSFNNCEAFLSFMKSNGNEVAAVIVEPIAANMGVVLPQLDFFQLIRQKTAECGSLFILDEVVTGFRIGGLKGAGHILGLEPDLITFGKIIGGGFPIGAVGGKSKLMDFLVPLGKVFQAGTFAGNPVSMVAGLASLQKAMEEGFYQDLDQKSLRFYNRINAAINNSSYKVCCNSIGSMFTLFFGVSKVENWEDLDTLDRVTFKNFFHFLFERGVLLAPAPLEANFISSAHSEEELEYVANIIEEFLCSESCKNRFQKLYKVEV
jgi:glutamate-1-semialdehyde 2,1-aminomutase